MKLKKIALCLLSLILVISVTFMYPTKSHAFGVVGSNALKGAVIGSLERAGIKFENREARERAFDAWNMKAYEKWKADEAAGRNQDLWEAFETAKASAQTPTPLDSVPGYGEVLINSTFFGMAVWIGAEIGLDIQQHSLDKTRMKYWADGFKEYEGISYNSSFDIRFSKEYADNGFWKTDVYAPGLTKALWGKESTDRWTYLVSPYKDDPAKYFYISQIKPIEGTGQVEIVIAQQNRWYSGEINGPSEDIRKTSAKNLPPLEKYEYVPKPTDIPTRNIPDILQPVIEVPDVGGIPSAMPSIENVPIIIPLDDPFRDNPHNLSYETPSEDPTTGGQDPEDPDSDGEEPTEPNETSCDESNEEMEVDSDQCEGIPYFGKKLEYIFGNATGNKHNIDRSIAMERQLNSIGVFDDAFGRKLVLDNLSDAFDNPSSILKTQENGRIVRESLLSGPNGVLKVESVWDREKLITVKLYGGK